MVRAAHGRLRHPLAFSLCIFKADGPFLVSPEAGVVGTYTLCMGRLDVRRMSNSYASNYDARPLRRRHLRARRCPLTISMALGAVLESGRLRARWTRHS